MTKEEYLKKRISDLEKEVNKISNPIKLRKNQSLALINYKIDLEREIARKTNLS